MPPDQTAYVQRGSGIRDLHPCRRIVISPVFRPAVLHDQRIVVVRYDVAAIVAGTIGWEEFHKLLLPSAAIGLYGRGSR